MQSGSAVEAAKPVRGRPFERGQSGNPGGKPSLFKVYAAEFGTLTPVEEVELRRAVSLMRRAERADDNNAVRMNREAREWLDGIRSRRAEQKPSTPTLADLLRGQGARPWVVMTPILISSRRWEFPVGQRAGRLSERRPAAC
jgi:hypothetical protein